VEASKQYDITGVHGAEVFRDLPEGLKLRMVDGALVEITGNPHDGAVLVVKVLEKGERSPAVGEEDTIFFADVKEVLG
jgi:hypothetical protein